MTIKEFLSSPWGIICVGVLSSIIGTCIYKIAEKTFSNAYKKLKYKRFIKRLKDLGEMYCSGYTAGYARCHSSFHQTLCVNKFIINILMEILKIVIVACAAIGLLVVFQEYIISRPIIIALASVIIAIQYQKTKSFVKTYQLMFDTVFGDDYKKHMKESVKGYMDKITGKDEKDKKEKEEEDVKEKVESDNDNGQGDLSSSTSLSSCP